MSLVLDGFVVALQPLNMLLVLSGVSVGTVVGMLPGIGPINAIAILLPVVFAAGLPAASALILLVGIRRALLLSDGEWSVLFSSPIAIAFWVLTLASLAAPTILWLLRRRREGGDCATGTDGGV